MTERLRVDGLFTAGSLRQAARAGWAACEGADDEARACATAARHEFLLDKGEPEPPGLDRAIGFILERFAPTYMEMEDLARSLDKLPLDPWQVKAVSKMRGAILEFMALRAGLFHRPGVFPSEPAP